jgi:YbbR domain-containing protein
MVDWRANFQKNWLYMLTAVLLSLFLWVAVSADRVGEGTYDADLLIANSDRRYVETSREPATDVVTVDFTGRVGELARLAVARPQVFYPIDTVPANEMEVHLTPDMVKGRGNAPLQGVSAIRVQPDRFVLHFQLRGTKTVPVDPNMSSIGLADGYVMSDSVRAEPGMVALSGPEDVVAGIQSVATAPVPGTNLRESTQVDVPLVPPDPSGLVALSATNVRVTVSVERMDERVFPGIPLVVSAPDMQGLRVEPSLVDVRISGPRSAVGAVRPEALSPHVEVGGPADLGRRLPILLPPPAPFINVVVDPDSARVVAESGG